MFNVIILYKIYHKSYYFGQNLGKYGYPTSNSAYTGLFFFLLNDKNIFSNLQLMWSLNKGTAWRDMNLSCIHK